MGLKERVVQGASELFFRNGIRSVTMSDIANHLGISKRTLYEVFSDKENLLEMCIDMHMKKADEEILKMVCDSENVISSMMYVYRKNLSDAHNVNKSVVYDLKKYHPRLYQKIECLQDNRVDYLEPLHRKGIEQGLIRPEVNFEICLWLVKLQFKILLEDEFIPLEKFKLNEVVRTIILNFVRGIATAKGHELIDTMVSEMNALDNN